MRGRLWIAGLAVAMLLVGPTAFAQERQISLAAAPELAESGLLKHMLPRFSLKNSIRVSVVAPDAAGADVRLLAQGEDGGGRAVFARGAVTYVLIVPEDGAPERAEFTGRFIDWLQSDTGLNTVLAFQPPEGAPFAAAEAEAVVAAAPAFDGDAREGERLSLLHCGRCHVVGDANRMAGLGSTPSFPVLRTFADWEERFTAFYVLKPHPAFTQIPDVTEPFDETRPPPIIPVTMSLDDLDAILAFVAAIAPADLGAPIQHQ
ncbi:hypothetical protein PSA7680_01462 [Pseudoruegeria aquimaris]|uniref:Cytochrome c domain-containing protein n=1 Tax=Pseudoruegeria aquimaris TaxID=393663 RepID=A0A1Y5S1M1_9RHOB|nr:hypothetical protein [Pseudoruegeria aquimaris]SLN30527.1 hypothetical protein PSA7680_01462 [Pseudoruegeria aquimaris]